MMFFDEESHRVVDLPADPEKTDPPPQATADEIREHLKQGFLTRRECRFEEHLAEVPLASDRKHWSGGEEEEG